MDELTEMSEKLSEINMEEINAPKFKIENWPFKSGLALKLGLNFFSMFDNDSGILEKKRMLELVSAVIYNNGEITFYTTKNYFLYFIGLLLSIPLILLLPGFIENEPSFLGLSSLIGFAVGVILAIFCLFKLIFIPFSEAERNCYINPSCDGSLVKRLNAYALFKVTKDKIYKKAKKQIKKNNKTVESFRDVLKDFSSTIISNELDK